MKNIQYTSNNCWASPTCITPKGSNQSLLMATVVFYSVELDYITLCWAAPTSLTPKAVKTRGKSPLSNSRVWSLSPCNKVKVFCLFVRCLYVCLCCRRCQKCQTHLFNESGFIVHVVPTLLGNRRGALIVFIFEIISVLLQGKLVFYVPFIPFLSNFCTNIFFTTACKLT